MNLFGRQAIEGALSPPPGVTPNFVNPPSITKYNVLCQAVCVPVVTVFVIIRLYTRVFIHRKKREMTVSFTILNLEKLTDVRRFLHSGLVNRYGAVVHQWDVPATDIKMFGKVS
ncbi:hypothetical protein BCON_0052g00320 [Botryotinia convoluta]|uniref:Uncharacterized protein n=1 Tax=Botryotinia convoluta TaxID=54673 RepID=A0A4Z1IAR3_9HELO|nr:hypothetical protein BCON_0052g00320 [Botryotinia convoluta]